MFESLDDQIKNDERAATTSRERTLRWVAVAAITVFIFGGLYVAMMLVE
ncbi:MAG: hypothetical protein ACK5AZ_20790 [Bryobacteraceae bacterium]